MEKEKKKDHVAMTIYQKLNVFADWLIRLVMINLMVIIFSLPLITIYPALCAGYRLFDDYLNQDEPPLIKGYFSYFKEGFGRKLLLGLMLVGFIGFGYWNVTYYVNQLNNQVHWFYSIGYYVTFAALIGLFAVSLYTFVVLQAYPQMPWKMLFKLSFYLSGKYFIKTIALMLVMILPYAMLLSPITFFLFIFVGLSTPLVLYAWITSSVKDYVKGLDLDL